MPKIEVVKPDNLNTSSTVGFARLWIALAALLLAVSAVVAVKRKITQ